VRVDTSASLTVITLVISPATLPTFLFPRLKLLAQKVVSREVLAIACSIFVFFVSDWL
jgi:hypothetical protein